MVKQRYKVDKTRYEIPKALMSIARNLAKYSNCKRHEYNIVYDRK